ncbi:MAG: DUF444 family protein, partial [Gammaproteobacteria bacterium]
MMKGASIRIPVRDLSEPRWRFGVGGDREVVHAGNHSFRARDRIRRPDEDGEGEGGAGDAEGGGGQSEDGFAFELSREEFERLFFDDLALPNMARKVLGQSTDRKVVRRYITKSGSPHHLHVARSLRAALARRIATGAQRERREAVAALLAGGVAVASGAPGTAGAAADAAVAVAERVGLGTAPGATPARRVPFIDDVDLRYRNRVREPLPTSKAAMFCLMDVSGSMDEARKDMAKRFFMLLYLFLTRHYETIELVFIRHHTQAQEVDEQNFFHATETGGTVVSSALVLMEEIVRQRYAGG